jgi:hypothetical protein
MKTSYNPKIVTAFFAEHGIPVPEFEYRFHPEHKWRFDLAWPFFFGPPMGGVWGIAVEVDGGIWIAGGHNRGAQIKKTWEKENEANCIGWHILKCEPKDLCTAEFSNVIKRALGIPQPRLCCCDSQQNKTMKKKTTNQKE